MLQEKWGEATKALVVLREGRTVEISVLMDLVTQRKGSYQAPKTIEYFDAIPLTPVGTNLYV